MLKAQSSVANQCEISARRAAKKPAEAFHAANSAEHTSAKQDATERAGITPMNPLWGRLVSSPLPSSPIQRKCEHCEQQQEETLTLQTKLTVGPANDAYEQEADAIANQVMSGNRGKVSYISRLQSPRASAKTENSTLNSNTAHNGNQQPSHLSSYVNGLNGRGNPLSTAENRFFSSRFNRSFDGVRIHTNSEANQAAKGIKAKAFTYANHIVFNQGAYQANQPNSMHLLAHELTHVVQQSKGGSSGYSHSVQRKPSEQNSPLVVLNNPRFANDPQLTKIANGQIEALSSQQNGIHGAVSKVQRALDDMGFDLPLHRVDGSYGDETRLAISQFRSRYLSDDLDKCDKDAIILLDQVAPAVDQRHEHVFDYSRLLADSRLDVTVAFGHAGVNTSFVDIDNKRKDSGEDSGTASARIFRDWLTARGFALALLGINSDEFWALRTPIRFPKSDGSFETRDIRVWVHLIEPGVGAASAFGAGLSSSEITLYNGHARYGSGPDFDEKASPLENFRIGIDAAMAAAGRGTRYQEAKKHGVEMDTEHDLKEMVASDQFDPDKYRVLFFQACTSMAYLDEVRSEIGNTENTDVIGSRVPTYFTTDAAKVNPHEIIDMLSGILEGKTVENILDAIEKRQEVFYANTKGGIPSKGIYSTSGIGDNEIVP
ncbi:DUF4157 domain-containing protein [Aliiglaciecola sp. NS0011-25]|uniref:eCIS core domain-containing protein n=1 Tax=Aliiglaciecola sp. NS0011-25 TaxID=3127654 RepID=UPI003102683C